MAAAEPLPVRITNVQRPAQPPAAEPEQDSRLFPEEGPAGGCASGECLPEAEAEPEAQPSPPPLPTSKGDSPQRLMERWRAAIEVVQEKVGVRQAAALKQARLLGLKPGEVLLGFLPSHGLHRSAVMGPQQPRIAQALSEHFGTPTRLVAQDVSPQEPAGLQSVAEQEQQHREAHKNSTEGMVRSHPAIHAVLRLLGGEIEHIQVYEPVRSPSTPAGESLDESA